MKKDIGIGDIPGCVLDDHIMLTALLAFLDGSSRDGSEVVSLSLHNFSSTIHRPPHFAISCQDFQPHDSDRRSYVKSQTLRSRSEYSTVYIHTTTPAIRVRTHPLIPFFKKATHSANHN